MDREDLERLAPLLDALGNRTRLAVLLGLRENQDMMAVADEMGITRGAVQEQVERLIELDLVYRPETSDELYALTPLGVFFAVFLEDHDELLLNVLDSIEEAEKQAAKELADVPVGEETRERMVAERKWELVSDAMQELLESL